MLKCPASAGTEEESSTKADFIIIKNFILNELLPCKRFL